MTNLTHTPAPWEDNGSGLIYGQCSGDGGEAPFVADVCNNPNAYTEQEQANARLIVAAPKLLAALGECANLLADYDDHPGEEGIAYREAIAVIAEAAIAGISPRQTDTDIDALLAERRQVAVIWNIEDVREIRPDLSDDQCWEVLEFARQKHDCELGLSWTTLECAADTLFGDAPETDNAGEE